MVRQRADYVRRAQTVEAALVQFQAHHPRLVRAGGVPVGAGAFLEALLAAGLAAPRFAGVPGAHLADVLNGALPLGLAGQAQGRRGHFQGVVSRFDQGGDHLLLVLVAPPPQPDFHALDGVLFALLQDGIFGGDGQPGLRLAGVLLDAAQGALFGGRDQGNGNPVLAGAGGAPNAVDENFGAVGQIVVENVGDVVHIQAAGGHVGGDQHLDAVIPKTAHDALAGLLREVAVEHLRRDAAGSEGVCQFVRAGAGADENQGAGDVFHLEEAGQGGQFFVGVDEVIALLDGGDGALGALDGDGLRFVQVTACQPPDGGRHGGGEESQLPPFGGSLQDGLDIFDEAHAEHLVGLVQHQGADAAQIEDAALEEVEETSGGADYHIHAAPQGGDLPSIRGAAVNSGHAHIDAGAVFPHGPRHLNGEFPRGGKNQRLGAVLSGYQIVKNGEGKGGGLARAGLRLTDDVHAGQHDGNHLRLNVGGSGVAAFGNGLRQFGTQAQGVEKGCHASLLLGMGVSMGFQGGALQPAGRKFSTVDPIPSSQTRQESLCCNKNALAFPERHRGNIKTGLNGAPAGEPMEYTTV